MSTIGILTNIGLQKSIEVKNNEGFEIFPTDFAVSSTQGALDPTRTTTNFDEWYRATISGAIAVDSKTVEVFCSIPPSQTITDKYVREIYLFARDSLGTEFLLAIGHPNVEILYSPSGTASFRLQIRLTNSNPSQLYTWSYTQATEISHHKVDLNAHPDIKRSLQDRILWEYHQKQDKNIFLRGGGNLTYDEVTGDFIWPEQLQIVNPFYGYTKIPAGSMAGLFSEEVLYSRVFRSKLFINDGDNTGIIKLPSILDFNDGDSVLIGDRGGLSVAGVVVGVPSAGENTVQVLQFTAVPNEGRWKLDFEGAVTGYLDYNSSAAAIKNALEALPNIDSVVVTGTVATGFTVTFGGVWLYTSAPQLVPTQITLSQSGVAVNVNTNIVTVGNAGRITVEDGIGGALDLSSFLVSNGAWVMRTNTSLYKGTIGSGDLRPTADGALEDTIFIVGIVYDGAIYLVDGREIRRKWIYEESVLSLSPVSYGDVIPLPLDSKNSLATKYYRRGLSELMFYINGVLQERSPIAVVAPFAGVSYDDVEGIVYTGALDLSRVVRGNKFIDKDGYEYFISRVITDGFYIEPKPATVNLALGCLVVLYDYAETGSVVGEERADIISKSVIPAGQVLKFMIVPEIKQVFGGGGGGGTLTGANIGSGSEVFKEKLGNFLRFRSISAGAGIAVTQAGDEIVVSLSTYAVPYFANYVTGQSSSVINTGSNYNIGTNKLQVFRNGLALCLSGVVGDPIDRYLETGATEVTLGQTAVLSDILAFVHLEDAPDFKDNITGETGTQIVVSTYAVGSDRLLVYRNGKLLNAAGLGDLVDKYNEFNTTTIELAVVASSNDVFLVEHLGSTPTFREDISGLSGTIIDVGNTYTVGDKKLLVFRNGLLLHNSTTIGQAVDRYTEYSNHEVELGVAAITSDVFTFIYL